MGKLKNKAEHCWELWNSNRINPDWEAIGNEVGLNSSVAEKLARDWETTLDDSDEPVWIG